jgi:uncharacterized NAD(P)/FAD-binding protein YdhS
MKTTESAELTIAIIGGGVSGALTAYHLIQQHVRARVIVIEPRAEVGLGLAYATPSLQHLLNVPAGKISALPSQPEHFLLWLRDHHDAGATAETFAPRAVFGQYIRSLMDEAIGIEQVRSEVIDYVACKRGALLSLSNGESLHADYVVLATGNFDPAGLRGISEEAVQTGVYAHNAWDTATYEDLAPEAAVTLIGSGLTSVDVLLRLRELGHSGRVMAISRHGVFPSRHASYREATRCCIPATTPPTCLGYVRALRQSIAAGMEWRAAVDSLRADTNDLWLALSLKEQSRFRRHLLRRWDVVRHRMAPSIADRIEAELAAGSLRLREGHLLAVDDLRNHAAVRIRTGNTEERFVSARVINCTGPDMNYRRVKSALLERLFSQGLASPGPLGTGLNASRLGALIDRSGEVSGTLFNLGPGRLGTLLESIAVPELRQQAVELAAILVERTEAQYAAPGVVSAGQVASTETCMPVTAA